MKKYYIFQIIWDIIRLKLKIKDIKRAMKMFELYDEIIIQKKKIKLKHIKRIFKLKISDIKTTLKIHNRYVKNSSERISLPSLHEFLIEFHKVAPQFSSNVNFNVLSKILDYHLKNIER